MQPKDITPNDMLTISMQAGELVLENGGETYRSEETMTRTALALGAATSSAFVTPTVAQLTVTDSNNNYYSAIKRIKYRDVNLKKLALVNAMSCRLAASRKTISPLLIKNTFLRIRNTPEYPNSIVVFMAALSSFAFAMMFGGSLKEAISAFAIGMLLRFGLNILRRLPMGSIAVPFFSGAVISVLSEAVRLTGFISSSVIVMTAVLMQVVPGLAIVNAIRDIIAGDLVSGTARVVEAFMIAAGLSAGSVLGVFIFGGRLTAMEYIAGLSTLFTGNRLFLAALWSAGAAGCSAFYFNAEKYHVPFCALLGAAGWVIYLISVRLTGSDTAGYLFGAFIVASFSEILAWFIKTPATVFLLPGLLPLVPGGGMFLTMRSCICSDMQTSLSFGFSTLLAAGAIALGIVFAASFAKLASVIVRYVLKLHRK